jgi:tyrosyl-tRNA synthetase
MLPVDEQMRLLMRGVEYGDEQIRAAMDQELRERLGEGRPLRVYLGVDPSAPDLTLGHTVPMYKLRQFQDLGHETVFLIGNFTGLVGDPSDKDTRRPILTPEELEANARTYTEQAFKVLDPERTIIDYNANWLGKLTFADLIQIASNFTVGQFLQRENFALRRDRGDPIYLHEFFYALMQGYDAVALRCDVQVGGTDQLFNIMAGRTLQRAFGQRPQVPVCVPILVGTDGRLRMSKTQGNHIALTDPPDDMYGKVMSLPDHLIVDYFTLVTRVPAEEVEEIGRQLQERSVNPMDLKKRLAREIVSQYHGAEAAEHADERFTRVFQRRELPDEALEAVFGREEWLELVRDAGRAQLDLARSGRLPERLSELTREERFELFPSSGGWSDEEVEHTHIVSLPQLLVKLRLAKSKSEARRQIEQGAVEIDGQTSTGLVVLIREGMVIRVGKHRFLRIVDADKR